MSGKTGPAAKQPRLDLPDTIASAQDLAAVILEIRAHAGWLAHAAVKQRVGAKLKASAGEAPRLSAAAAQLLTSQQQQRAGKSFGSHDLEVLIKQLEARKAKAPVITITLAAPASNDIKRSLTAWCRANITPDVLVNFAFNRDILGGMVVRSGSQLFDWSFRRQILDGRDHFPEVLRHVR